jgi:hypothetical protein
MSPAAVAVLVFLAAAPQDPIVAGPATVHFWPEQEALATRLGQHLADAPPLPALPANVLEPASVDVYLAPDAERWDSLTGGAVPEWGAGVADPFRGVIVLPTYDWVRTPPHTVYRTLRHELAHVALQRYIGSARSPRWFTEGYAQWAAGQWDWDSAWRLRLALAGQRAPPLDSLTLDWPVEAGDARIAYLLSASAVAYLVDQNCRTAELQNSRTAEQQNGRTAERQNGRTAELQNSRTAEQQTAERVRHGADGEGSFAQGAPSTGGGRQELHVRTRDQNPRRAAVGQFAVSALPLCSCSCRSAVVVQFCSCAVVQLCCSCAVLLFCSCAVVQLCSSAV